MRRSRRRPAKRSDRARYLVLPRFARARTVDRAAHRARDPRHGERLFRVASAPALAEPRRLHGRGHFLRVRARVRRSRRQKGRGRYRQRTGRVERRLSDGGHHGRLPPRGSANRSRRPGRLDRRTRGARARGASHRRCGRDGAARSRRPPRAARPTRRPARSRCGAGCSAASARSSRRRRRLARSRVRSTRQSVTDPASRSALEQIDEAMRPSRPRFTAPGDRSIRGGARAALDSGAGAMRRLRGRAMPFARIPSVRLTTAKR